MDLDTLKTYGPIIAAFIGALVGSSIKEISAFYQLRREDRRQLKSCLFNQLELRFEISRYDTSKIADFAINYLSKKLAEAGCPEEQIGIIKEQLKPQLKVIIDKIKLGEPGKLREQYQGVVSGLAKIDPILAYKISGRAGIEQFFKLIEAIFDEADNQIGISAADDGPQKVKALIISHIQTTALDDALNQTKKDIYSIARRVGYYTLARAFLTIRRSEKRLQESATKEVDDFIKPVLEFLQVRQEVTSDKG